MIWLYVTWLLYFKVSPNVVLLKALVIRLVYLICCIFFPIAIFILKPWGNDLTWCTVLYATSDFYGFIFMFFQIIISSVILLLSYWFTRKFLLYFLIVVQKSSKIMISLEVLKVEWVLKDSNKYLLNYLLGFPGGLDVKVSVCSVGDLGSIPGLERSRREGDATHSSVLAWKIPWMKEHRRLQFMGSQRVGHD